MLHAHWCVFLAVKIPELIDNRKECVTWKVIIPLNRYTKFEIKKFCLKAKTKSPPPHLLFWFSPQASQLCTTSQPWTSVSAAKSNSSRFPRQHKRAIVGKLSAGDSWSARLSWRPTVWRWQEQLGPKKLPSPRPAHDNMMDGCANVPEQRFGIGVTLHCASTGWHSTRAARSERFAVDQRAPNPREI